eukprot:9893557-Lingulodinium_polyedra.AAC.1
MHAGAPEEKEKVGWQGGRGVLAGDSEAWACLRQSVRVGRRLSRPLQVRAFGLPKRPYEGHANGGRRRP